MAQSLEKPTFPCLAKKMLTVVANAVFLIAAGKAKVFPEKHGTNALNGNFVSEINYANDLL